MNSNNQNSTSPKKTPNKSYWFRVIGLLLAVVLIAGDGLRGGWSGFTNAGDQQPQEVVSENEIVLPEEQEEETPVVEIEQPQEEAQPESQPEEAVVVAEDPAQSEAEVTTPVEEQEATEAPEEEATEAPVESTEAPAEGTEAPQAEEQSPIALMNAEIANRGAAYISVGGELYSASSLRASSLMGTLSGGIALAKSAREGTEEEPAVVSVVALTEDGLVQGYVDAGAVALLDYDEVIEGYKGEDNEDLEGYTFYQDNAAWPMEAMEFVPEEEGTEATAAPEATEDPDATEEPEATEEVTLVFEQKQPAEGEVPAFYTVLEAQEPAEGEEASEEADALVIYTFTDNEGQVYYRVFGLYNGVLGFYACDEQGNLLEPIVPVDVTADALLVGYEGTLITSFVGVDGELARYTVGPEDVLADLLPTTLSVVLDDESVVELPVEWKIETVEGEAPVVSEEATNEAPLLLSQEEAESIENASEGDMVLASDSPLTAGDLQLESGDTLIATAVWSNEAVYALSEEVEAPYVEFDYEFSPLESGTYGTLNITNSAFAKTKTTYNLVGDTNTEFEVRYLPPSTGTKNYILVVNAWAYGQSFEAVPDPKPFMSDAQLIDDFTMAIVLTDGLITENNVLFQIPTKTIKLTDAQAQQWMDEGVLPSTTFSAQIYEGTLVKSGNSYALSSDAKLLLTETYGSVVPESYNISKADITSPNTYVNVVPSVGAMTNMVLNNGRYNSSSTSYYIPWFMYNVTLQHPFISYAMTTPHGQLDSSGKLVSNEIPLVEITGIRVYAPDNKLKLDSLGGNYTNNTATGGANYTVNYTALWSTWTISERKMDAGKAYYEITPPAGTRWFNTSTTNAVAQSFLGGMRLNWQLVNEADELTYSTTAYTTFQANDTRLLIQVPSGVKNAAPVSGYKSYTGPKIQTMIRNETDLFSTRSHAYRYKGNGHEYYKVAAGANYPVTSAYTYATAINNHYYFTGSGTSKVENVPTYTGGDIVETYEYPYEIQPTLLYITPGMYVNNTYWPATKRETQMKSIKYYDETGKEYAVSDANITSYNTTLISGVTSAYSIPLTVDTGRRVKKVVVTWSKIRVAYHGYYNAAPVTTNSTTAPNYTNATVNTQYTYNVATTQEDGSALPGNGKEVQVKYTLTTTDSSGKSVNNENYLWYKILFPGCPLLYHGYNYPTSNIYYADNTTEVNSGAFSLSLGGEGASITQLQNPEFVMTAMATDAESYPIDSATINNNEALFFLTGKFSLAATMSGWDITFSTNKRSNVVQNVGTLTTTTTVDIGLAADEYLTALKFSYTGMYRTRADNSATSNITMINNVTLRAYNENVRRTAQELWGTQSIGKDFSIYRVDLRLTAQWDNCNCDDKYKHDPVKFSTAPQPSYYSSGGTTHSYKPGLTMWKNRSATWGLKSVTGPAQTQTIFQGGSTKPEEYATYTMNVGATGVFKQFYQQFYSNGGTSSYLHGPYDTRQTLYVELTDPEFTVNTATTKIFGVPIGDNLSFTTVKVGTRSFLKFEFAEGYARPTTGTTTASFTAESGQIRFSSGTSYYNIAGDIQIGLTALPGTTIGSHYPLGEVYYDISDLVVKYQAPTKSGDGKTEYLFTTGAVVDTLGLSSNPSYTGAGLFKTDFSDYEVKVVRASALTASLVPGKSGTYQFGDYTVSFLRHERNNIDALMSFTSPDNAAILDFTSYIALPRKGVEVTYETEKGVTAKVTSQYDVYLEAEPTILFSGAASGAITYAYTTDPKPSTSSTYTTTKPTTTAGWEAVTGIRIAISRLPADSVANISLDLKAQDKSVIDEWSAYIGGTYTYIQEGGSGTKYDGYMLLGTYKYNNYNITSGNGGFLFYDMNNENGVYNSGSSGETVASGVTVNLYEPNGTTLIMTTTSDASGNFKLSSYTNVAGQIIEVVMPTDQGTTVKMTTQSASAFTASGTDSDFNRTTNRLVLTAIGDTGFGNISGGLVKLPVITAADLDLLVGQTANIASTTTVYMLGSKTSYSGYSLANSATANASIATSTAASRNFTGTGTSFPYTHAVTGVAVGTTKVTLTATNRLGDTVTKDVNINVKTSTKDYKVTLNWVDSSNALTHRPANATIQLYRHVGAGAKEKVGTEQIMTGTGNAWSYTYTALNQYDSSGKEYTYTVEQIYPSKNYTVTYGTTDPLVITDTLKAYKVTGKKVWNIIGTGFTPTAGVTIELYRNGTLLTSKVVTGTGTSWDYEFTNLVEFDIYDVAYTYTVKEKDPASYLTVSVSGTTVTNTYPADKKISVKAEWDHTGAPTSERPTSATLQLTQSSANYGTAVTGNTGNTWSGTVNVPNIDYVKGNFGLKPQSFTNYTVVVSGDATNGFVAKYTYIMPKVTISGTKTWKEVPTGVTVPTLTFRLVADGVAVAGKTTTLAPGASTFEFKDLDKYTSTGVEIVYTVTEDATPGYTQTNDGKYNFTNTYSATATSVPVTAQKNVSGDTTAAPNDSFSFKLTANPATNPMPSGAVGGVLTMNATKGAVNFGNISYTYPGTYAYTIEEVAGTTAGYTYDNNTFTMTVVVSDLGGGALGTSVSYKKGTADAKEVVFTNNYTIPTKGHKVTVNWVDNNDALAHRPSTVTIALQRKVDGGTVETVTSQAVTAGGNWTHTFTNQPEYDSAGKKYTYSVLQTSEDKNYGVSYSAGTGENEYIVTDTLKTTKVEGKKIWNIIGTEFTPPVAGVTVELYRNGTLLTSKVVTGTGTSWDYFFDNLVEFDKTGTKYTYTVKEKDPASYLTVAVDNNTFTITNTYAADQKINVEAKWENKGAPLADRPTTVVVNLLKDGAFYKTVTLNTAGNWKHTFDVPQKDYVGSTFTIEVKPVPTQYEVVSYTGTVNDTLTANLKYVMPKVKVEGTKTWKDVPTGVTVPTVTVRLLKNGSLADTTTMAAGVTTYSFDNLDKYDEGGIEFNYTVEEAAMQGYIQEQNKNDFTNTYSATATNVAVTAQKDVTGTGVSATASFKFKLTAQVATNPMPAGSTAGVKEIEAVKGAVNFGSISYTVPGTYVYTIEEVAGTTEGFTYDTAAYTMTVVVTDLGGGQLQTSVTYKKGAADVNGMDFSNSYVIPTRDHKVEVKWEDNNNTLNHRPGTVIIELYRKVEGGADVLVDSKTVSSTDSWQTSFTGQPIHDNDGKTYTYTVVEKDPDANYTVSYGTGSGENTYVVTNTINTIKVAGKKVWNIVGTEYTKPAAGVVVELYRNGTLLTSKTVTEGSNPNEWSYEFESLVEFDTSGTKYTYTVKEKDPPAYLTVVEDNTTYTITNTYGADQKINVEVKWDHEGAPSADQPTTVVVNLLKNGEVYKTITLNSAGNWKHTFDVPQKDYVGNTFTIEVKPVPTQYEVTSYTGTVGDTLTANLKYVMPLVTVSGTKTWKDVPTGVTVPTVTIRLLRNGEANGSTTITSTQSTYEFKDLHKYDKSGNLYTYTVTEDDMDGYIKAQSDRDFTNTYSANASSVAVTAQKNATGTGVPNDTFKFKLTALNASNPMPAGATGGVKEIESVKGSINFDSISFTYPGTYAYTIEEVAGTREGFVYDASVYTMTVVVTDATGGKLDTKVTYTLNGTEVSGMVFENKYTIPTRDHDVTVEWKDNNDELTARPPSIVVELVREDKDGNKVVVEEKTVTPGANWETTFEKQPIHDENGGEYTYTVREKDPDKNYDVSYEDGTGENEHVIINTIKTTKVDLTKVWNIVGTEFTKPAAGIVVELYRNGTLFTSATVTDGGNASSNQWTYTFDKLLEFDSTGTKYVYTIKEKDPAAYLTVTEDNTTYTITNTYGADQKINIEAKWDHEGAPVADQPTTVVIKLLKDGADYKSITLNGAGFWRHTFDVPQKDYVGSTFTIEVNPVPTQYKVESYAGTVNDTLIANLKYVMPLIDVSGTKTWKDVPTGVSVPVVTVRLLQNGTQIQTTTIASGSTTYEFKDLDTYDKTGVAYTYTVTEDDIDGYIKSQDKYDLTNTYSANAVTVPVNAVSKSVTGNGAPNISFTFKMVADDPSNPMPSGSTAGVKEVVSVKGSVDFDSISYTYPGTYTYTFTETAGTAEGFTYDTATFQMKVEVTDATGGKLNTKVSYTKNGADINAIQFVNAYVIPTRDHDVTVEWKDNDDEKGARPPSITVELVREDKDGNKVVVEEKTVTPGGNWETTFEKKPIHDDDGNEYTYTVREKDPDKNYDVTYEKGPGENDYTIINTLKTIKVEGKKVWSVIGSGFTKPSTGVDIELYRNGTLFETKNVNGNASASEWGYEFTGLLEFDSTGTKYDYTVKEKNVPTGIISVVDGYIVTNTYPADESVTMLVDWDHTGAPAAERPPNIVMKLMRDGVQYGENIVLNASNSWTRTIGITVADYLGATFTIEVETLPASYSVAYSGDMNTTLVAKLTYIMPLVSVEGTKTWVDVPSSVTVPVVTVNLLRNGVKDGTTTIASGDSTYKFENLHKYDPSGIAYTYTVEEDALPGYVGTQSGNNLTNTYSATAVQVPVTAQKDVTGIAAPAQNFTFRMVPDDAGNPMPAGTIGGAKEVTAGEGSVSFGEISFTRPGTYVYTITENNGTAEGFAYDKDTVFKMTIVVTDAGEGTLNTATTYTQDGNSINGIAFNNIYTIPTRDHTVRVLWDDNNDGMGLRPGQVTIELLRKVEGGTDEVAATQIVTATPDNWEYIFTAQPVHDNTGKPYTYSIRETNIDESYEVTYGTAGERIYTVTNKLKAAEITAKLEATPTAVKTGTVPVVEAGKTIGYTITVTNQASRPVVNVRVMQILPKGITVAAADASPVADEVFVNADGTTTVMWKIPSIPANSDVVITLDPTVDALASGELSRLMTSTAYYRLPTSASESFPAVSGQPDAITGYGKTQSVEHQMTSLVLTANPAEGQPMMEGEAIQYTLKLNVAAPTAGAVITAALPADVTFFPGSITSNVHSGLSNSNYNSGARSITWPSVDVPVTGASVSFRVVLDKFTGVTSKTYDMQGKATLATAVAPAIQLSSNQLTHIAQTRTFDVALDASLVVGGSATTIDNGSITSPVEGELGQTVEYTVTVGTQGFLRTGDIIVENVLEDGMAMVAGSTTVDPLTAGGVIVTLAQAPSASNGNKAIWTIGNIPEDGMIVFTYRATLPKSADDSSTPVRETKRVVENLVNASDKGLEALTFAHQTGSKVYTNASEYDKVSNSTYHVVYAPALDVTKTSVPASPIGGPNGNVVVVEEGDTIAYAITVSNTGHADAKNVRVMDILPEGVTYTGHTGIAPNVYTDADGRTVLIWVIPNLAHINLTTGAIMGTEVLAFTVTVDKPTVGMAIDNTAYYRIPGDTEPGPSGPEDPEDFEEIEVPTNHQTYTFTASSSPMGGDTAANATLVPEGKAITFTLEFAAGGAIKDVDVTDIVPQDMSLALGSIQIVRPDGTVQKLPDTLLNTGTGVITFPTTNVTKGKTLFQFTMVVNPLPTGTMDDTYVNQASVSLNDGTGNTLSANANDLHFKTNTGFSGITLDAALVDENGVAGAIDNGTSANPVVVTRGGQVEYTIRVSRDAAAENRSGDLIVTDMIPEGMTLVSGSIAGRMQSASSAATVSSTTISGGVRWTINGMADGEEAILTFRAKTADEATDPFGTNAERRFVNVATLTDVALQQAKIEKDTATYQAGTQIYNAARYQLESNKTYHLTRYPLLSAVLTADLPDGGRVIPNGVITFTITVTNDGEADAGEILVRSPLAGNTTYVDGSLTSDYPGTVTTRDEASNQEHAMWILPELPQGESANLTFKISATALEQIGTRNYTTLGQFREATAGQDPYVGLKNSKGFKDTNSMLHYQSLGATVTAIKIDATTREPLAGALFELEQISTTDPQGQRGVMEAYSDEDGYVVFEDVPLGKYILREVEAPEGYIASPIVRSVDIDGSRTERSVTFPNRSAEGVLGEVLVEMTGVGNANIGVSAY